MRQRHGDLRLLVEHCLARLTPIAAEFGVSKPHVSDEAMDALASHLWPGNLDELESVLEARPDRAERKHPARPRVDPGGRRRVGRARHRTGPGAAKFMTDWAAFADMRIEAGADTLHADAIAETERKLFTRVLRHTRGNQAQAARILGITRASLRKKLRMYGMVAKPAE